MIFTAVVPIIIRHIDLASVYSDGAGYKVICIFRARQVYACFAVNPVANFLYAVIFISACGVYFAA